MADAFRRSEQVDETIVARAIFLQSIDRGDRGISRREYCDDDDEKSFRDIGRRLEVVFDGGQRRGTKVKTDMSDAREGERPQARAPTVTC